LTVTKGTKGPHYDVSLSDSIVSKIDKYPDIIDILVSIIIINIIIIIIIIIIVITIAAITQ